jgi:hypothetical protein
MAEQTEPSTITERTETPTEQDVAAAIRTVLEKSDEPLTLSKIRAGLPTRMRGISLEALAENLRRQVAANVLYQYPKYRSQQDRFWDRPMPVHVAHLLRLTLEEKPLALPDLRRKLPDYAKTLGESVLNDQVAQGRLFQHPPASKRTGPRYGASRPEPKEYLRQELSQVFQRLEQLGFTQTQLREGALELLHEEEWATQPTEPRERDEGEASSTPQSEDTAEERSIGGPAPIREGEV